MDIDGLITPMCTPVTGRTGGVDHEKLAAFTRFLVEGGVHGLFPLGSTGEFSSFTSDQRRAVIETVVANSGDQPVYAGCSDTSYENVRRHISEAADAGADAAVVVTPYYLPSTDASQAEFYRAVADESPLPILLYHIPDFTGQSLSVREISELSHHDRIAGIKDTSRDLTRIEGLIERTAEDFAVLQGATALAVVSLYMGADGLVPSSSNVYPDLLSSMYDESRRSEWERALYIQAEHVVPFIDWFSSVPALSAIKYCVSRVGPDLGPPLPPLPELTADQKSFLDDAVEDCGPG